MKFDEALKSMKLGNRVKLPHWDGFWYWDDARKSIMMQCSRNDGENGFGKLIDIREIEDVEETVSSILSGDWIISTKENTPIIGGESTFDFNMAKKYLLKGYSIRRKNWDKPKRVCFVKNVEFDDMRGYHFRKAYNNIGYVKGYSFALTINEDVLIITNDLSEEEKNANDWMIYHEYC